MRASGLLTEGDREREPRSGLMAPSIPGSGSTTEPTARAVSSMLTGTYTRAIGSMTWQTVSAFTRTKWALSITGCGKTTTNMVTVLKFGLTNPGTKVTFSKERKTVSANFFGRTAPSTLESSEKIFCTTRESTPGPMDVCIRAIGSKAECMVKGSSHGRTVDCILACTSKIRKMGTVSSRGLTAGATRVSGGLAVSMAKGSTMTCKAITSLASGTMVDE